MSKITNDDLTWSGTGRCTRMATVGVKRLNTVLHWWVFHDWA